MSSTGIEPSRLVSIQFRSGLPIENGQGVGRTTSPHPWSAEGCDPEVEFDIREKNRHATNIDHFNYRQVDRWLVLQKVFLFGRRTILGPAFADSSKEPRSIQWEEAS